MGLLSDKAQAWASPQAAEAVMTKKDDLPTISAFNRRKLIAGAAGPLLRLSRCGWSSLKSRAFTVAGPGIAVVATDHSLRAEVCHQRY
jgi:hypothetical protein